MAATFERDQITAMIPGLPGGNRMLVIDGSFDGTNSTYNYTPQIGTVLEVIPQGTPLQITTGTTLDAILVNNSVNASGAYTLISGAIQLQRSGTNSQDFKLLVIGK